MRHFRFSPALPRKPLLTIGDGLIVLGIAAFLYAGIRLSFHAPTVVHGPEISLSPLALPWCALLKYGAATVFIASGFVALFQAWKVR